MDENHIVDIWLVFKDSIDSKKIDTDSELSFEISVDTSFFQEEVNSQEEGE